jgi:uncharacterized protein (DUF58 family)
VFLGRRAVAAALVLAIPAAFWPFGWIAAAGLGALGLAAAAALDWGSAVRADRLQVSLECPDTMSVGQTAGVWIGLHNPTTRPIQVGVHVYAPSSMGRAPARQQVAMGPGQWGRADVRITPTGRGYCLLGPLTIRTPGRWGIAGRQQTLLVTERIKVYPALPGRKEVALRLNSPRFLMSGIRPSKSRGEGTAFDSLREYHPDDEFRRINWRATARAGKPISNTYIQERNQRVLLMMDAGRTMSTSIGGFTRFELAIDSGVALAELAANLGDHVGMMAFGRQPLAVVAPKGGKANSRRILDQLFDLYPTLDASNYHNAFSALLARFSRRALLVLLTELTDPSAMESLFRAMPALVTRHLVVVGAVTDPAVIELCRAAPLSSEEVYLKAAAEASLATRRASAQRLRSMGATVIDAGPMQLPGRLADEYLRIKAHGRL